MKNLVIGSVAVAALSQAAGCVFVTDSSNDALLTAHWELENFVGSTLTTCPVGFNTATVISQPVDNQNNPIGAPFFDLYDCEAHGGTLPLPPGPYSRSTTAATTRRSSTTPATSTWAGTSSATRRTSR